LSPSRYSKYYTFCLFLGYDDESGGYIRVLKDHLSYRYEVVELAGKGSFGQVIKAYDHKNKEYVAIKIIRNKKRLVVSTRLKGSSWKVQ